MGQDDRVALGVRQAEAAEHVRELVLQPGARGEHDAGKPGGDETFRARLASRPPPWQPPRARAAAQRRPAPLATPIRKGVRSPPQNPPTQWAMAFMPLAALTAAGSASVSSGS